MGLGPVDSVISVIRIEEGCHSTIGNKTPTLGGDYNSSENTAYSASVRTKGVFKGTKGALSPTAFKHSADEIGVAGSCNDASSVGPPYKTGGCG